MQSSQNYNNVASPPNLIGQQMDNNLHIHKSKYYEIEVIIIFSHKSELQ